MDTRTTTTSTTAPQEFSWKLITAEDVLDRLHVTAGALGVDYSKLQHILIAEAAPENTQTDMESHIADIEAAVQKAIDSVATTEAHDERVKKFIAKQRDDLQLKFASVKKHLIARKRGLLDAHKRTITDAQNELSAENECFYGNYTYKLDILKKNIIVALQKAAEQHAKLWKDYAKENRPAFNRIFSGLATLQENGSLEYDNYNLVHPDVEMQTLSDTQALINNVLHACQENGNNILYLSIKEHLSTLSRTPVAITKDGSPLFTVGQDQDDVQFTAIGFKVEELSQESKEKAKAKTNAFLDREADLFDDFADDDYVRESQKKLLATADQAFNDIETFEQILRDTDQIHLRIQDAANNIPALETSLQKHRDNFLANVNEITFDQMSNRQKNPLYELYYLDDERRERIIDKLDEALDTCYERLDYKNKVEGYLTNVTAARNEITNIQDRVKKLTDKAAAKPSPLAMPEDELRAITHHMEEVEMMLRNAEIEFDQLQAAFVKVEDDHILDRAELANELRHTRDWDNYRFELKRSKVTLDNLGPTKAPEEKPGFWARNRWLKGVLIGAAVGLGIAAATVAVITPMGLVATAIAAIGIGFTVSAIVGGSALLTAIGGLVGGLIGKFTGPKPEPEDNIDVSSTAVVQAALVEGESHDNNDTAPKINPEKPFIELHAETAPPSKGQKKSAAIHSLADTTQAARNLREQAARNVALTQNALEKAQKLANGGKLPKGKEEAEPDNSPVQRLGSGVN